MKNWFGDIQWHPAHECTPTTVDEIVRIVGDPDSYPGPVRAVGSNHSTTPSAAADGGTTLFMSAMAGISIDAEARTVTASSGESYIDVARQLEQVGLQFFVNIELGDLSMGAAATVGTKEAAFPGEYGQVSSYLKSARIVTAAGALLEITEDDTDLMSAFRSSYGTFGITYEVTFHVRPMHPMAVHHRVYSLDAYLEALPDLLASEQSLMMYMDPLRDRIAVEFRSYTEAAAGQRYSRWQWRLRNFFWRDVGPLWAYSVKRFVPGNWLQNVLLRLLSMLTFPILRLAIRGTRTAAADQQIHYPPVGAGDDCRYTFSIWAYPVDRYPETLRAYFAFCKDYYRSKGLRVSLPNVGYRTFQDTQALLSYSFDGMVCTIDPVTTPEAGWDDFLLAYNAFASSHGGRPLLNQTKHLTRQEVRDAYGSHVDTLESQRAAMDPNGRFLSPYFRDLLG